MTNAHVEGVFSLVYLVFNGIGNLLTQDEQVACFENAAAHLEPGGCFLIESGVPGLRRLPPGAQAEVFATRPGYVGYDLYVDLAAQLAASHHVVTGDAEVREFVSPFRYVWPSELDLMARIAGMKLRSRWADWDSVPVHRRESVARIDLEEVEVITQPRRDSRVSGRTSRSGGPLRRRARRIRNTDRRDQSSVALRAPEPGAGGTRGSRSPEASPVPSSDVSRRTSLNRLRRRNGFGTHSCARPRGAGVGLAAPTRITGARGRAAAA